MTEFVAELKQWGNSYGLRIPKGVAERAGLAKGDAIPILLEKKRYDIDSAFGIWKGGPSFERDRDDRY